MPETTLERLQSMLDPAVRGRMRSGGYPRHLPRIRCADGFNMSVQASSGHYCKPRDNAGPWHKVEVGFPSERVAALMPFAETPDRPTETVYRYVPLETVARVIDEHGGFAEPA